MTQEQKATFIATACAEANYDAHITWLDNKKDACTLAEKIAVNHMEMKVPEPVKNSYLYLDSTDACFYFDREGNAQVAFSGHIIYLSDDVQKAKAFDSMLKVTQILARMQELTDGAKGQPKTEAAAE